MAEQNRDLKHADRDPDSHITLDEVENEKILMGACAAYLGVMRMLSPEIGTFGAYWSLKNGQADDLTQVEIKVVVDILKKTPEEHWQRTCIAAIEALKELDEEEGAQ